LPAADIARNLGRAIPEPRGSSSTHDALCSLTINNLSRRSPAKVDQLSAINSHVELPTFFVKTFDRMKWLARTNQSLRFFKTIQYPRLLSVVSEVNG
jgi:hypothetical protein